jgi:hypothetical protein
VIHSEDVLHGSPITQSDKPRRVVYFGARTIEEQLARGMCQYYLKLTQLDYPD